MVQRRAFRADLYYRLNVFPIVIPPLRHRIEDIPLLVAHFLQRFAQRHRKDIRRVPDEVLESLKRQHWLGNVRELQNVIERAVIATTGMALQIPTSEVHFSQRSASKTLAEVEREHILDTLRAADWVIGGWNGAAARLGLSRTTLIARMQRLGLSREARVGRGGRSNSDRHTANAAIHPADAEPTIGPFGAPSMGDSTPSDIS